jgi:hypothetical protein
MQIVPHGVRRRTLAAGALAALGMPKRWTPARKLVLLAALENSAITPAEARKRYAISAEEIAEWQSGTLHAKKPKMWAQ